MEKNLANVIEELTKVIKNQNETIEAMGREITNLKFTIEDLNAKIDNQMNEKPKEESELARAFK